MFHFLRPMENIYIQTSQNIKLEQTVASIGERIVAQLIDYAFFAAYGLVAWLASMLLVDLFNIEALVLTILLSLPILFYDLFCEIFFNGQNAGKRFMKLIFYKHFWDYIPYNLVNYDSCVY